MTGLQQRISAHNSCKPGVTVLDVLHYSIMSSPHHGGHRLSTSRPLRVCGPIAWSL